MAQSAIGRHVAACLAGIPSQPTAAAPHPLEGIVSADASTWNEDVTRSRRYITVADAERINTEHGEAEAPREHPAVCTALDGQCTGEYCGDRGDPREPIHHGPEHGLNVSFADYPLNPFQLTQWEGEQPLLTVYAGGAWPDLSLAQVDELLLAFDQYTAALRETREHLARAVAVEPLASRCPAAHREDPTPCDGPLVVTVRDASHGAASGCEHHGARLLASLNNGRVFPLPDAPEGAALRVFKTAATLRPFAWLEGQR
ncbi:hypothetical protein BU52_10020 [Streptomyces toyocaensis]|uniref:Uncharacterized protein n=1 Tax=Streptomyces toyocaensis TaxID=55952 RepID=A0A081XUV9_STRTO|nr:hypothetical protein [Streptomyces toyocaensis]KES07332.1 hypothetical protein BU52_10020 [Streptomyces toyocaensis]